MTMVSSVISVSFIEARLCVNHVELSFRIPLVEGTNHIIFFQTAILCLEYIYDLLVVPRQMPFE
jgi:hypothetical protein